VEGEVKVLVLTLGSDSALTFHDACDLIRWRWITILMCRKNVLRASLLVSMQTVFILH